MPGPKIKLLGLTREDIAAVLRDWPREDICRHLNISRRTLDRLVRESQLQKRNYGPKGLERETVAAIREDYGGGAMTQKEIAEKFGVSQPLVSKIVNRQVHRGAPGIRIGGRAGAKVG